MTIKVSVWKRDSWQVLNPFLLSGLHIQNYKSANAQLKKKNVSSVPIVTAQFEVIFHSCLE